MEREGFITQSASCAVTLPIVSKYRTSFVLGKAISYGNRLIDKKEYIQHAKNEANYKRKKN